MLITYQEILHLLWLSVCRLVGPIKSKSRVPAGDLAKGSTQEGHKTLHNLGVSKLAILAIYSQYWQYSAAQQACRTCTAMIAVVMMNHSSVINGMHDPQEHKHMYTWLQPACQHD
jgi:hypothetical protein